MEHGGWMLPPMQYSIVSDGIRAEEPEVTGQRVSEFVTFVMDRLNCFVEDVTVHCMQAGIPAGLSITEVPLALRDPDVPERFRLTLKSGGMPTWTVTYHQNSFEET